MQSTSWSPTRWPILVNLRWPSLLSGLWGVERAFSRCGGDRRWEGVAVTFSKIQQFVIILQTLDFLYISTKYWKYYRLPVHEFTYVEAVFISIVCAMCFIWPKLWPQFQTSRRVVSRVDVWDSSCLKRVWNYRCVRQKTEDFTPVKLMMTSRL